MQGEFILVHGENERDSYKLASLLNRSALETSRVYSVVAAIATLQSVASLSLVFTSEKIRRMYKPDCVSVTPGTQRRFVCLFARKNIQG